MSDDQYVNTNMGILSRRRQPLTVAMSSWDIAEVVCAGKNMLWLAETMMHTQPDVYEAARVDALSLIRIGGELQEAYYASVRAGL